MVLSDSRVKDDIEMEHTVHRDFYWFIGKSDMIIAYYPDSQFNSLGLEQEMRMALSLGKPVVLIHPDYKQRAQVFGVRPNLGFSSAENFFEVLHESYLPKYDKKPEGLLRCLLRDKDARFKILNKKV